MTRDKLSVLVVSAHLPFPPRWGFGTRVYQLMRQLASRHDATLLCYAGSDDQNVERLRREFPVEVVRRDPPTLLTKRAKQMLSLVSSTPFECRATYSREMQKAIDRLCTAKRFDVIQIESPLLADFRFPRESVVVLDEHNLEYEVFERMYKQERSLFRQAFYRLEHARFRRFEQRSWRDVHGCAVTSQREEDILRRHAPGIPVRVVPNGVDLEYFRPSGRESDATEIVFNGVLDYRPNLEAANFLVDEVLPRVRQIRSDARLAIVGRTGAVDLEPYRQAGVDVTGEVPDIRPYLERAAVVVVPIRMGGGTRLKVVEGLALARPMVSTTLGCEGVNVRNGEQLLIGDTADSFAAQVLRVLENPSFGAELGQAGRALMEREYSWDAAGERLEELYADVVALGARDDARSRGEGLEAKLGRFAE